MLGSTQADRSNAVGHVPSYLPEVNPGMTGGNTYTAASSEPTIQDYENIFGPSARDIKTDLQRFKRHGRWHLPDVLKGPNPWLTDRIDGLITDATNSPFTTKILPYLYKEDPDGKFTWNVWQFDEGMASRVPYESAARHLTQSKRSFEGYMVRHGMAIVLEHNFMMSPKGRENFKNQLNQLIGSIQYSNDFDVHMALVLAPSYQKTMREKYFTIEKTSGQLCRDYCDLFGMMQKNVNALDILIEEAKAILKTWGGPMPDFLLCNSKLTFQLTMTPEKTNYITQGIDGVKRLKQGPDLSSYRGLSVIHSRAFSLEAGQQPRDILRRRVRTAEYYRILPHKDNYLREFELYTEERDGWFTLTFNDLLRYASHEQNESSFPSALMMGGSYGSDNHRRLERVYLECVRRKNEGNTKPQPVPVLGVAPILGLLASEDESQVQQFISGQDSFADSLCQPDGQHPLVALYGEEGSEKHEYVNKNTSGMRWGLRLGAFDLGIKHIAPRSDVCSFWAKWGRTLSNHKLRPTPNNNMVAIPRLSSSMRDNLFKSLRDMPLFDPFKKGPSPCEPGRPDWYLALTFYQEVYQRYGVCMDSLEFNLDDVEKVSSGTTMEERRLVAAKFTKMVKTKSRTAPMYISDQVLGMGNIQGLVNHEMQFLPDERFEGLARHMTDDRATKFAARSFILTHEVLSLLFRRIKYYGSSITVLDFMVEHFDTALIGDPGKDQVEQMLINVVQRTIGCAGTILTHTFDIHASIVAMVETARNIGNLMRGCEEDTSIEPNELLVRNGVSNWPMGMSTRTHFMHPRCIFHPDVHKELSGNMMNASGFLSYTCLQKILELSARTDSITQLQTHHFFRPVWRHFSIAGTPVPLDADHTPRFTMPAWKSFWGTVRDRIRKDPFNDYVEDQSDNWFRFKLTHEDLFHQLRKYKESPFTSSDDYPVAISTPRNLAGIFIDTNRFFGDVNPFRPPPGGGDPGGHIAMKEDEASNVEIVIIRPNIEHNMLGVIMGLAGSELGYTLWGQTELACYDDSMHGIWGMSYKYHERAIVFNERNLVRLWDIAYDGYNGGKDDTYVDWKSHEHPRNGLNVFRETTIDLGRNYRGPSMMVMAFVHDPTQPDTQTGSGTVYDKHFRRNWPSPIVFHDSLSNTQSAAPGNETLPLDNENLQVSDVEEFRVFNNPLYQNSYGAYKALMPAFNELHKMRKSAGQASADSETHIDCLAFQGSMRIKQDGRVLQDIQGSGHHGPDYVGVASVRAGKGIKYNGMAPALTHMV